MVKQALIIASILSALVVTAIVGVSIRRQAREAGDVKAQLQQLRAAAEESAAQVAKLQQELTNSHARIEALIREKEQVARTQRQMEEQMRAALQNKDVTISELQGKLTVNILDRVLFASGEADLKPEGEKVLSQVAPVLMQHTNRQVFVIGHTDNVPIRASVFSRYASNWELSTARATSAVRYLTEKAGVDPARLAAVGYGEFHPIAENSTPEGRARNRRIEIVIMPEPFNPLENSRAKTEESGEGPRIAPAPEPGGTNAPVIPPAAPVPPGTTGPQPPPS